MPEQQNEEFFRRHLNTTFTLKVNDERALALELEEVRSAPDISHARGDLERFSLYFRGPADVMIHQQTCRLEHPEIGALDIFLVPVEQDARGLRYEAVFSCFK